MVFTVLGAVAELERSLIAERVRAGLRNACAKGKRLGRPRCGVDADKIKHLREQGASWRAVGTALGVAPVTCLKTLRRSQSPTETALQTARVLRCQKLWPSSLRFATGPGRFPSI
jgi:DNA invertase Pin-like site-specific DNA recombinase